ncbi:MAG: hypothetical protein AAFQ66_09810 [Pseudomonadota bacterium]
MADDVLARVSPAPARRWFALVVLATLGGLLTWLGLTLTGGSAIGRSILVLAGLMSLALTYRLWSATTVGLVLTSAALTDTVGTVLITLDQVKKVERSAFSFKPSNGFLIIAKSKGASAVWAPGLWWRFGRYIGVGGVCGAGQTKAMADILAAEINDAD